MKENLDGVLFDDLLAMVFFSVNVSIRYDRVDNQFDFWIRLSYHCFWRVSIVDFLISSFELCLEEKTPKFM